MARGETGDSDPSDKPFGDPGATGLLGPSTDTAGSYPKAYAQIPAPAQLPQWTRQGQPSPSGQDS